MRCPFPSLCGPVEPIDATPSCHPSQPAPAALFGSSQVALRQACLPKQSANKAVPSPSHARSRSMPRATATHLRDAGDLQAHGGSARPMPIRHMGSCHVPGFVSTAVARDLFGAPPGIATPAAARPIAGGLAAPVCIVYPQLPYRTTPRRAVCIHSSISTPTVPYRAPATCTRGRLLALRIFSLLSASTACKPRGAVEGAKRCGGNAKTSRVG
jgi:hypothetical protein